MTTDVYTVPADIVSVHDGDTCVADLQLGWWVVRHSAKIRILGLWCPELSDPGGVAARDYARELLPVGLRVTVVSALKPTFDRTLASIRLQDGRDFASLMIAAGHGTQER